MVHGLQPSGTQTGTEINSCNLWVLSTWRSMNEILTPEICPVCLCGVSLDTGNPTAILTLICVATFLATLVALHFTPVSESVSQSVGRNFELA